MKYSHLIVGSLIGFASTAQAANTLDFTFATSCQTAEKNAVISFDGDILVHDGLYQSVIEGSQNFSKLWAKTNGLVNKADYSVANLEGPAALGIDTRGRDHGDVGFTYDKVIYSGTNFSFNYHPRILKDLQNSGYDLLTMANNHALDRHSLGIDRTLEAAEAINLPTVGTRHSQDRNGEFYHISEINGLQVAFIGCTESTNGNPDKKKQVLLCYEDSKKITALISKLRNQLSVDAVVVLPHWGEEYQPTPNKSQRSYAHLFLEAGATAIVGSHPHVLQPWEKYTTQDGRETLVAYSLGNFLAFQAGLEKKASAVIYIGLSKENGKTSISNVGYTPTYRDSFETRPVDDMSSEMSKLIGNKFGVQNRIHSQQSLDRFCR